MTMRHVCLLVLAILFADSALAAPDQARRFAPVQGGLVASAPEILPWAPDRLLVRFTPEAFAAADLDDPLAKAVGPRTGLASLDAAMLEVSVTSLAPSHPDVADKERARDLGIDRWYTFELAAGSDVPAVAKRLAADPALEYALPDLRAYPAVTPNDPLYPDNWGHDNTAQLPEFDWDGTGAHTGPGVGTPDFDSDADAAWDGSQGFGSGSVIIAILDSGVDSTHPDLNQMAGYDYGDNDNDPHDDSDDPGHGTACAGVAAAIANNGVGVVGVAGGSTIMPLKVSNQAGSLFFSAIIDAVYHAADNGADVISMSFGAAATVYAPMDAAVTYAYNQGAVLLAATGNENTGTIGYPAYNPLVIGVGAASPCGERKRSSALATEVNPGVSTDPNGYTCDGERWWGSNWGLSIQDHQGAVDIIAPTILPTTDIQDALGYDAGDYSGFFNGTSCATPYAAGVCALIKAKNPTWTPAQIRAQLVGTAADVVSVESGAGWDRYTGYGMVDAASAVDVVAPPSLVAAFSGTPTVGCAPLTVAFTDESTGVIDTWAWDFGDGGTSFARHPSHDYTVAGIYDVRLIVTNAAGSDTALAVAYVTAQDPASASFTPSATVITVGDSVTFTDTSTGGVDSWSWGFGDGGTSNDQHPTHQYLTPGTYTVGLFVTGDCGDDLVSMTDLITVNPGTGPTADFEATPPAGCAPLTVDFSDLSTGIIDAWTWDFGDGGTDNVADPSHEYTVPGVYDVRLIVTNAVGADTLTVTGMITVDAPPSASFTASATSVTAGDPVTFTDTSTGAPTGWDWDFGDGGVSTLQNPDHVYTTAGLYTVTLIATNACGPDTLIAVDHVTVAPPPAPVAGFTLDPAAGCAPLEVTFTDQSGGDIDTWSWDFGDGGSDGVQNPVHTFVTPGSYDVRLIVSGPGGVDTLTVPDAVVVEVPVTAAFAFSDTLGPPPMAVAFTDQSSGSPTSWLWDFGDAGTDTVQHPVHTYTADGIYDVTLIVANGCSADTLTMVAALQVSALSATGDQVPASFGLAQNYPNPFNPMTTIVFSLKADGPARLEVYDLTGRRVDTLVNEHRTAGEHRVTWQPRGLASGVYFTRFTAGGQTVTKRVTLLK